MLRQLENIFGADFWKNVVLEFTFYAFSEDALRIRGGHESKTENGRKTAVNKELKKYFGFQVRPFENIFKHCD